MTRRYVLLVATIAAALCGVVVASSLDPQQTVFRGTGDTVRVFVTVLDKNERLATALPRDIFEVRDNGRPQPVTVFDNSPQPIRLIVMLDVSGSMERNLPLLRAASIELFNRLGPDDAAKVGTFGHTIDITPEFTKDARALQAALPAEIPPDAPTPLWRGINQAMSAFDPKDDRRHVVLVLSDGKDSPGFTKKFYSQLEIIERATAEEVMIYAIGLRSRSGSPLPMPGVSPMQVLVADLPDPGLGKAAIETGGGYFELSPRDDFGATFARVADELHSQYLLGYAPPARDGKTHKIEVKVSTPGLKVRARKSYVAPRESR
jgi:Ca-activated chloride channel family protein